MAGVMRVNFLIESGDFAEVIKEADIIISGAGKPQFITPDMVKDNVTIIDVGITRLADSSKKNGYRLVGDVAFEEVSKKAA
jgi:methylenetetrahydrofolate dehydrogenase (NADP+)/methenyltetrahydrofolate cyclohydrolase